MGKFLINTTKTGFTFHLKAGNGQTIAVSQTYKSKKTCIAGAKSVANNALAPVEDQTVEEFAKEKCPKYEIYNDKKGEFRFRLKASNGQIICSSEGYTTMKACKNGIASIGKNAPDAEIIEAE